MGRILFLTNIDRQYIMMDQARDYLEKEGRLPGGSQVLLLNDASNWGPDCPQMFSGSDLVLFSWMGTSHDTHFLKKATAFLREQGIIHTLLATDPDPEDTVHGVTPAEREIMRTYLLYSGMENYRNLWLWLACTYSNADLAYQKPQPLLWNGIFHPQADTPFTNGREHHRRYCRPDRPTIGILFPRDEWVWADLAYQTALVAEIERQGMNAMAVFSHWARNPEVNAPGVDDTVQAYFYVDGMPVIDVLLNTFKFSLTVGRPVDQEFLHRLDVPVLQAYGLLQPCQDWQDSIEGMTPMEVSCSISMPEFDGIIHGVPVAAKENLPDGTRRYLPIPDRLAAVVRKAGKWARLRRKANSEKKIAIIFHNYPATNSNIGSAQGMDSPASIRLLLQHMAARGYRVDHIPADSQTLMNELLAQATNDRRFLTDEQIENAPGKVSEVQYRQWFGELAAENQEQLRREWGAPPGDVFYYDGELLVPGMLNGNIFITVQPPRGFGEDPGKILHSPDCAPTHHYLAYYHWVRDIWQADAVVHVGTHGTLEWLPGKGMGLSRQCYPDLAIGDLPNVYPYLITIVGEGIQAKRRGAACLIGHLPPPMSHADIYEELAELEKLLDEYAHFKLNQPGNTEVVANLIREKVLAANLSEDLPEQPFDEYVQRLHAYVTDIKNMQIRVGLHVLGCPPQNDMLAEYLLALTRMDNGDIPSLPKTIAAVYGYDYYELIEQSGQLLPDGSKTCGALLDDIRDHCRQVVTLLAECDFSIAETERILNLPWAVQAQQPLREQLRQVTRYICEKLVPSVGQTDQEITNLLRALESRYIEPGPAGSPTSGMADILPTGRNFYGVDPRTLPSPAAWEIGKTLGDGVIERYIREEGRYPENIGMVIWCGANMRSHGQCIAEFLYLLGVKPVWQKGSLRVVDLEIIPAPELKRPRIDVMARISGLLRDAMPTAAAWMDKAVGLVAQLDESPEVNYVRKHVLNDAKQLAAEGVDSCQAWEQACYRVFGCPPGAYGAGVGHLLEEKNWETVDDLAKVYVRWGAHAYGSKVNGAFVPQLFSKRLGSLDVTVKNEDNREVHMLNSDDFNAYHGGMIAAVRSLKGEAPRSYCGDSSDRQHVALRSLAEEFKRLFRGEVMNPKYIEGMKQHGYKGAADLAGVVAHCYEWDATSDVMEDWMYDGLAQKYALDGEMRQWMQEVNPWALQRIADKLLEAEQRGLWQADNETKQELQRLYLAIEGELEERGDENLKEKCNETMYLVNR
ncbi:MAG TPA: cobaltochelatase subunit CobN [Methylomusa anaerophila]|uniref:Aerobic cobaltochelatase subunit CobN n=1 Tax=Methylomusa anaerophila TaxID=1930071 RepID=A0A348AM63_9FIRM|nr:cobaltochelatase subunit CobN [Methylomusa anaerophila]BBB92161.1 aerobic cobaltochelatase subunit CobN [Methylomusa anaerophila]HML87825.1 cobaltochelatase subunit CobN [Methylomusa anaerophila]